MNSPLTLEQLEKVRRLDACSLANTIETFGRRLRNEGFIEPSVHCLLPQLPPMLGYAATVKILGSSPPTTGSLYADRTDWWDYIISLPWPRVVAIQDVSEEQGVGALVGAVHLSILQALGSVGVVTNGAVRDIRFAQTAGFHLFAGGITVSHAYAHILEFGRPISIGGLRIEPGDLLHGDLHGVQCVPLELVPRIPGVAARIAAREEALIELCHSHDCSIEKLREAVRERLKTECRNRLS